GPAARAAKTVKKPAVPDARRVERGLVLLGEVEILPVPCDFSPEFVTDVFARTLLANKAALLDLARGANLPRGADLRKSVRIEPLPRLYGLARLRRDLAR